MRDHSGIETLLYQSLMEVIAIFQFGPIPALTLGVRSRKIKGDGNGKEISDQQHQQEGHVPQAHDDQSIGNQAVQANDFSAPCCAKINCSDASREAAYGGRTPYPSRRKTTRLTWPKKGESSRAGWAIGPALLFWRDVLPELAPDEIPRESIAQARKASAPDEYLG